MIADITAKLSQLWFPFSHKSAAWCPLVFVIFSANNSLTPLRHSYRSSSSCNSKTQGPESYKRYKLSTLHITSIYRSFLLSLLFHLFSLSFCLVLFSFFFNQISISPLIFVSTNIRGSLFESIILLDDNKSFRSSRSLVICIPCFYPRSIFRYRSSYRSYKTINSSLIDPWIIWIVNKSTVTMEIMGDLSKWICGN